MSDVICYSESPELAEELASVGDELARALGGSLFSIELDERRSGVRSGGKVLLMRSQTPVSGDPELTALALAKAIELKNPSVVLIGTTRLGREIASRIAVRLRVGSLVEVNHLSVSGGALNGGRSVYAGKFQCRVSSPLPCVAVVRQGAYPRKQNGVPSVEEVRLDTVAPRVQRVERRAKAKTSVDLKSASVIVSAGRGIKKKDDLELVERLALAVGGVVGCSRPLSSDLGWLGEEHHIGLTGIYVHPELYIAVGISGQLQHVAGIKESKVIVAINKDKQAPIFQVADYGLVGDLYAIIPALLSVLEETGKS